MHDRYAVLSPEKVVISFALAGLMTRLGAALIDLFVLILLMVAFGSAANQLSGLVPPLGLLLTIVTFFLPFIYSIAFELWMNGRTPGKQVLGLRVIKDDGTPIDFKSAFLRSILKVADLLPGFFLVGLLSIAMTPKAQRLGDLAAQTIVVVDRRPPRHFVPSPHRVGLHPLEDSVGDLGRMTMEEYLAIKRLCDRFPLLPLAVQAHSIDHIWQPFAARHGIEPLEKVHPIYQMEAVVMKYGRRHNLV